ncbi:hypothetical protein D3C71_1329690 [compost metagenome]
MQVLHDQHPPDGDLQASELLNRHSQIIQPTKMRRQCGIRHAHAHSIRELPQARTLCEAAATRTRPQCCQCITQNARSAGQPFAVDAGNRYLARVETARWIHLQPAKHADHALQLILGGVSQHVEMGADQSNVQLPGIRPFALKALQCGQSTLPADGLAERRCDRGCITQSPVRRQRLRTQP